MALVLVAGACFPNPSVDNPEQKLRVNPCWFSCGRVEVLEPRVPQRVPPRRELSMAFTSLRLAEVMGIGGTRF